MLKHESQVNRIMEIFVNSDTMIRPHFFLTGPSGSSKSYTIAQLAEQNDIPVVNVNAAQLTKEGTAGNSLSKALTPIANLPPGQPVICFVDEFDKLFISGNQNSELAHETTNGVQNEFLTVLESDTSSVFGDYGKYVEIPMNHVLFVFAGAFNGEEGIDLDRLKELGVKTEFLGRVGLVYNTEKVTLEMLKQAAKDSQLRATYLELFDDADEEVLDDWLDHQLTEAYDKNTLGYRIITTLLHQYFIEGGKKKGGVKEKKRKAIKKALCL